MLSSEIVITCDGISLIVRNKHQQESLTIATFSSYDSKFCVRLCPKFKTLNYLFTLPKSYILQPFRMLPRNPILTTFYKSVAKACDYVVFSQSPIDQNTLSSLNQPRNELIQLPYQNILYLIEYITDFPIEFINVIPSDNQGYPLVDSKGNNISIVNGRGSFCVVLNQYIAVKSKFNPDVQLTVTALRQIVPIASITGPIYLKIKTCLGIVLVRVADKFNNTSSTARIPVEELEGLSNILFYANRSQISVPCFGTLMTISAPGPYLTTGVPDSSSTTTVPITSITRSGNDPFNLDYVLVIGALNMSPYWIVNNLIPGGTAIQLFQNPDPNAPFPFSVYEVDYNVSFKYQEYTPITDIPPSFWMSSTDADSFLSLGFQCSSQATIDKVPVLFQNNIITFKGVWKFDTSCGSNIEFGFYPETMTGFTEIELVSSQIQLTFISTGVCGGTPENPMPICLV